MNQRQVTLWIEEDDDYGTIRVQNRWGSSAWHVAKINPRNGHIKTRCNRTGLLGIDYVMGQSGRPCKMCLKRKENDGYQDRWSSP